MQKRTFTVGTNVLIWLLVVATGSLVVSFVPEIIMVLPNEFGNHHLTPSQLQGLQWVVAILLVSGTAIGYLLGVRRVKPRKQVEERKKFLLHAQHPDEIVASLAQELLKQNRQPYWNMSPSAVKGFIDEQIGTLRSFYREHPQAKKMLSSEEEEKLWSEKNLKSAAEIVAKQRGRVILLPRATRTKQNYDNETLSI